MTRHLAYTSDPMPGYDAEGYRGLGTCGCHGCRCDGCARCDEPEPADLPRTPVIHIDPWAARLPLPF